MPLAVSHEIMEELHTAFWRFDRDRDGQVRRIELAVGLLSAAELWHEAAASVATNPAMSNDAVVDVPATDADVGDFAAPDAPVVGRVLVAILEPAGVGHQRRI